MALDDRKRKAIELLSGGDTIAEVSRSSGVSRQTIYTWLENDEFKAELDRALTDIRTSADRKIAGRLDDLIRDALELAQNGRSEKVRADMLQYLINRVAGSPAAKQAVSDEQAKDSTEQVTPDQLRDELARFRQREASSE